MTSNFRAQVLPALFVAGIFSKQKSSVRYELCPLRRGISGRAKMEDSEFDCMKVAELKAFLKKHGQPQIGIKAKLVRRDKRTALLVQQRVS